MITARLAGATIRDVMAISSDPLLEDAAAHWQRAFEAAARALDADRIVLPAEKIGEEMRRLTDERRLTAALLESCARVSNSSARGSWSAPMQL